MGEGVNRNCESELETENSAPEESSATARLRRKNHQQQQQDCAGNTINSSRNSSCAAISITINISIMINSLKTDSGKLGGEAEWEK